MFHQFQILQNAVKVISGTKQREELKNGKGFKFNDDTWLFKITDRLFWAIYEGSSPEQNEVGEIADSVLKEQAEVLQT